MEKQPATEGVEPGNVVSKDAYPGKFCTACGAEDLPESCNHGPCPHALEIAARAEKAAEQA